ncbi:MAG: hypothetical protein DI547_09930 [Sphingobium sp.]|nr:MAG: hypothetical protein DI547_09930 [Sphingobium sp.]
MIIAPAPRVRTILADVWKTLLILFVWDCVVTAFFYLLPYKAPSLPLTIFGTALALFLGLRDNSAYQRWWEGRILWGAMINSSRSLARALIAFIPDDRPDMVRFKQMMVLRQITYVNVLRRQLRRQDSHEELSRLLPPEEIGDAGGKVNIANALLTDAGRRIADAQRAGHIDTIQQTQLEAVLVDIANHQGGMERLKNTPLPNGYRFFPSLFTRLFCVLLPVGLYGDLNLATPVGSTIAGLMFLAVLRIADDLVDPFADSVHDVPITAICRTVEIDLKQTIGMDAPKPVLPDHGVLW